MYLKTIAWGGNTITVGGSYVFSYPNKYLVNKKKASLLREVCLDFIVYNFLSVLSPASLGRGEVE